MSEIPTLYGGPPTRRVRTRDLLAAKDRGDRWPMLTSYDQYTASIFDQAGIPVLLVGDSAANNVFGYETTLPVTVDELLPLVRAVVRATKHRADRRPTCRSARYEEGPTQALRTAVRFMKEGGCPRGQAGGRPPRRRADRGDHRRRHPGDGATSASPRRASTPSAATASRAAANDGAEEVIADARAVAEAGAFAVVLEMVPGEVAKQITKELPIPTVGIGAGPDTDAQVLVWQDMAGLRTGKAPRFVKRYADLAGRPHRGHPAVRRRGPRRRVPRRRAHLLDRLGTTG